MPDRLASTVGGEPMPRESKAARRERATKVCERLQERYPDAACALHYTTPFTLVISVLLSAQTTDAQVNRVTPELFERWGDPVSMAAASADDIARVIHPLGFFRSKAAHCVGCAQAIVSDYGGEVPRTMEELQTLPGVGRKTANIVMNNAFGIVEGIAVDTHVFRIATRLGLTHAKAPGDAEKDLLDLIPRELWGPVNHTWILLGREICDARRPRCEECPLADLCPSAFKPPVSTRRKGRAQDGRGPRA
jgi:endonuclease-3